MLCRWCALRPASCADYIPNRKVRRTMPRTQVCRECVWRLTQMAFHPDGFEFQALEQMANAHADVLSFAITTTGGNRWVWIADGWPGRRDATTLR